MGVDELSARARRILGEAGIKTKSDALKAIKSDRFKMLGLPGLGRKTKEEVYKWAGYEAYDPIFDRLPPRARHAFRYLGTKAKVQNFVRSKGYQGLMEIRGFGETTVRGIYDALNMKLPDLSAPMKYWRPATNDWVEPEDQAANPAIKLIAGGDRTSHGDSTRVLQIERHHSKFIFRERCDEFYTSEMDAETAIAALEEAIQWIRENTATP